MRYLSAWRASASNPEHRYGKLLYVTTPGQYAGLQDVFFAKEGDNKANLARGRQFYVNDGRVFRAENFPSGPSSIPYLIIQHSFVFPGEGHENGQDDRPYFIIHHLGFGRRLVRIRGVPDDS